MVALAVVFCVPAAGQPRGGPAIVLHLDGVIGPASADYLARALGRAAERKAPLVIVRMDTPGGLDTSMRAMIRDILASPVPVVIYVSPSGARAASAGAFLLYASHVAAMAPGTNVGAATPVQIGGVPTPGEEQPKPAADDKAKDKASTSRSAMDAKAINDAAAYIRSLAELRGRNADWAEKAVREAASLSASAALRERVIDIEAKSVQDLLAQLHGRTVSAAGNTVTLATHGLGIEEVRPDWRTELLSAITNPNVALILMMVGIYGLIFEFMNPGFFAPGTIGAICLLTGLYALAALPVNFAGLALIALGIGLLIAEMYVASFGTLGLGGVVAIALGATILIDTDVPGFRISWSSIAAITVASLLFVLLVARLALLSRGARVVSGREEMVGVRGVVDDWKGGEGHVFAHGERWRASGTARLGKGQGVRVTSLDGLTLHVEPDPPPTGG
ncbi:NfeD family protein [Sphingomonas cavernae]|uniref:NfeD family protein n=1 Tax=Sphingomonas cavernae TaxID=2320861 RepID=UPI001EE63541|nr:nodulation protein NfeD [Sphingomonas cavernae]